MYIIYIIYVPQCSPFLHFWCLLLAPSLLLHLHHPHHSSLPLCNAAAAAAALWLWTSLVNSSTSWQQTFFSVSWACCCLACCLWPLSSQSYCSKSQSCASLWSWTCQMKTGYLSMLPTKAEQPLTPEARHLISNKWVGFALSTPARVTLTLRLKRDQWRNLVRGKGYDSKCTKV